MGDPRMTGGIAHIRLIEEDSGKALGKVDTLDIRIVRAMLESKAASLLNPDFKKSYSSLARSLKVDENTVKNRVQKLYDSGFLKGWWVALNPTLIGQQMSQLWFDVKEQSSKQEVIEKVSLIPGVAVVKDLYGRSLGVVLYHEGDKELKKTMELISRIAEADDMTRTDEPFAQSRATMTSDDVRIIRALQKTPLKSYTEIGKGLGLSARTVKRRVTKLSQEEALYMVGELDPRHMGGGTTCSLLVFYDSPEHRYRVSQEILSLLGDSLLFAELDDAHHAYFALVVEHIVEAKEILKQALAVPGVARGRMDLLQEIFNFYGVYEEQLEKLQRTIARSAPRASRKVRTVLAE